MCERVAWVMRLSGEWKGGEGHTWDMAWCVWCTHREDNNDRVQAGRVGHPAQGLAG